MSTKGRTFPVELLSHADITKLLGQCSKTATTGIRNHALIVLLWRSGLRIQEAIDLELKDIDMAAGTLSVLRGKGGKQRQVAVDRQALDVLQNWLARRSKIPNVPGAAVFCTLNGAPLCSQYARDMLKRLAYMAGVEKRVHPHALRHAFMVEMIRERVPLNVVQQQVGHSSLATTSRYLAHVATPEVLQAISGRTW